MFGGQRQRRGARPAVGPERERGAAATGRVSACAMGQEVVSERGGGARVTVFRGGTVTAQRGAQPLHPCQSLGSMKVLGRPGQRGDVVVTVINRRADGALAGRPLQDTLPPVVRALT